MTIMESLMNDDFWFGAFVIVLPLTLWMVWEAGAEKVRKIWLDGYSAGLNDKGGK